MLQTRTSHLLLTICTVSSFIPTDTKHKHCCCLTLSAFRHFHISHRIEQRSRLVKKFEPDSIQNRLGISTGFEVGGAPVVHVVGRGPGAAFREAPEGPVQSPGGDPGCKGPESSSILENLYGKNEAGLLQSSTFYFYS